MDSLKKSLLTLLTRALCTSPSVHGSFQASPFVCLGTFGPWLLYGLLSCRSLWFTVHHYISLRLTSNILSNLLPFGATTYKTVNQGTSRSCSEFPNDTLRQTWDILQVIRGNFKLHPHFPLFHVKGHQNNNSDHNDLPFPLQSNVQADLLAKTFQQASSHATDDGLMIPGTDCHLLVENQFIPGYQRGNSAPNGVNAISCGISRRGINCQMQMPHTLIWTAMLRPSPPFNTKAIPSKLNF
jgi:hypothetical protein